MKLSRRHIQQLLILAAIGGLATWIIGNYENLVPYRWESLTTADGRFSLQFPGKPVIENRQGVAGDPTITWHLIGTTTDEGYYSFAYFDPRDEGGRPIEDLLDSARDGSIRNVQGSLVAEKRITIQGYPAREVEVRGRHNLFLDMRLIAIDGQVYILGVASTSEQTRNNKSVHKFLDSLVVHQWR